MDGVTGILSREHQVILKRLDRLEAALAPYDRAVVADTLRFFDEGVSLHRRKEEEFLFPTIAPHFPPDMGPVACMLHEHKEEKELLDGLRESVGRGADQDAVSFARRILDLLRNHIAKEDGVLFPMAERLLDEASRKKVAEGFASVGNCCGECASHAR